MLSLIKSIKILPRTQLVLNRGYPCYTDPDYPSHEQPSPEEKKTYDQLMKITFNCLKSNNVGLETKSRISDFFRRNGTSITPSYTDTHKDYAKNICQLRSILLNEYFNNKSCPDKEIIQDHIIDQWYHRKNDLITMLNKLKDEEHKSTQQIRDLSIYIQSANKEIKKFENTISIINDSKTKISQLLDRFKIVHPPQNFTNEHLDFLDSARMTESLTNPLVIKDIRDELKSS